MTLASHVSTAIRGTDKYTFRDYLQLVQEDQKAHLLNGFIIMESPCSTHHEELLVFLTCLLGGFVSEKDLGKVYGSKASFKLGGYDAVEPDISFVAKDRLDLVKRVHVEGPPDLAVEVISKGTRKLDYEGKKPAYEKAGTRELWIIDYLREHADFFYGERRRFTPATLEGGTVFRSRVLPGLQLDVRWLWSDPLPKVQPILRKMLRRRG